MRYCRRCILGDDRFRRAAGEEAYVIRDVTGIHKIRMVYLQLLYRCNFDCLHCFHGERLQRSDAFSPAEAISFLMLMRDEYGAEAMTLLGGEPFVYKELPQVVHQVRRQLGLRVEICTNGYRIERRLVELAPDLDFLRVSLEGTGATNDHIRKRGSYQSAVAALQVAHEHGVATGATMTVTSVNIDEVVPLARTLQEEGAAQLKLHCLRPVGNAFDHPELFVADPAAYTRLRDQIHDAGLQIEVVLDADLSAHGAPAVCAGSGSGAIDRIEADPRGALTMSCKAVGKDAHAFWYDKGANQILYRPSATDELTLAVPDVVYARA
jgi:Fe-coproporphyrin III synthase